MKESFQKVGDSTNQNGGRPDLRKAQVSGASQAEGEAWTKVGGKKNDQFVGQVMRYGWNTEYKMGWRKTQMERQSETRFQRLSDQPS